MDVNCRQHTNRDVNIRSGTFFDSKIPKDSLLATWTIISTQQGSRYILYTYAYIYIYTYIKVYICTYASVYIYIYIYIHMYVCIHKNQENYVMGHVCCSFFSQFKW